MSVASAVLVALFGCGDVKGPGDFVPGVDDDVGEGSSGEVEDAIEGDPCGEQSPWECDPVTGEGCEGEGIACGFWGGSEPGFYCLTQATEPEGSPCDVLAGPWCGSGTHCSAPEGESAGVCARLCCGDGDCEGEEECVQVDWSPLSATLGVCSVFEDVPDAGVDAGR